jgi:hypothetical protein
MNRSVCRVMVCVAGVAVLGMTATLAALAGSAMAQAPDAGCALPSEPEGIPGALDTAITGPADKDRDCMKALLIPEARMMFVSLGATERPPIRSRPWTIGSPTSKPVATPCWKTSS